MTADHKEKLRHKPHYLFSTLLSILAKKPLDDFYATWDVGATGRHCDGQLATEVDLWPSATYALHTKI